MRHSIEISVPCVAEIDSHIGASTAHVIVYDPSEPHEFEIASITNKYGSERSGDTVSDGLYREIAEEVYQYFVCMYEAQCDAMEDR